MATHCYAQVKGKIEFQPAWKEKPKGGFEPREQSRPRGSANHLILRIVQQRINGIMNQLGLQQCQQEEISRDQSSVGVVGEITGLETTNRDIARVAPHIYDALEDQQVTYQAVVVKFEGKIAKQSISTLIDPRSIHSYLNPKVSKSCWLERRKHAKSSLVQLATIIKRKVIKVVKECPIELNEFLTTTYLNVLPLGLYDALIGMDWLEKHRAKVDYYDKVMECIK